MKYQTFEIGYAYKDGIKFIDVVACNLYSALADCKEAGFEVITAKAK